MAKLVIGKSAPKSFPLRVEVPTPTGTGEINFEAKHMPSTAWAKMREAHAEGISKTVQALFDAARADAEKAYADSKPKKGVSDEDKEKAVVALIKPVRESEVATLRAKHSGDLISQIAEDWDLDEPISPVTLAEMCDTYPGAAEAVFSAYNQQREGVRLGN